MWLIMLKNVERLNKKGFKLIFGFSIIEDIGNFDKIRFSEGIRVKFRDRESEDRKYKIVCWRVILYSRRIGSR